MRSLNFSSVFMGVFVLVAAFALTPVRAQEAAAQEGAAQATTATPPSPNAHLYESMGFNELFVLHNLRILGKNTAASTLAQSDRLIPLTRTFIQNPIDATRSDVADVLDEISFRVKLLLAYRSFGAATTLDQVTDLIAQTQQLITENKSEAFARRTCPDGNACAKRIQKLGTLLVSLRNELTRLAGEFEREGSITSALLTVPVTNQLKDFLSGSLHLTSAPRDIKLLSTILLGKGKDFDHDTRLMDYIGSHTPETADALRALLQESAMQDPDLKQIATLIEQASRAVE